MRTALCPVVVFLLLAILASASPTAASEQSERDDVEQLKNRVEELTRRIEQMQREHQAQQDQITQLKTEIKEFKGEPNRPGRVERAPQEPNTAEDEMARLRALAEGLAGPKKEEKSPEETVYKSRGLSLQQLNPEISVSGDLLAFYRDQEGTREHADVVLRALELNFQSYLDPFSRMKATVGINGEGEIGVEEAYFTHFTLIEGATLDIGRFRQPFGIVNRWHEDALDQVHYPLAVRRIFGEGGSTRRAPRSSGRFPSGPAPTTVWFFRSPIRKTSNCSTATRWGFHRFCSTTRISAICPGIRTWSSA